MENQLSAPRKENEKKIVEDKFVMEETYTKTNEGWIAQLENEGLRSSNMTQKKTGSSRSQWEVLIQGLTI